jgi:hypothetical protein
VSVCVRVCVCDYYLTEEERVILFVCACVRVCLRAKE